MSDMLSALEWAVLGYFLLVNGFYLLLLGCATLEMRRHLLRIREETRWRVHRSRAAPNREHARAGAQ